MGWLPLESNPEVLNPFVHRLGLPPDWGFADVFGLDPELLCMVRCSRVGAGMPSLLPSHVPVFLCSMCCTPRPCVRVRVRVWARTCSYVLVCAMRVCVHVHDRP
jgi:hypothetical protein